MHAVKAAADAGRVPAEEFDELRRRFNGVQTRAIEAFGDAVLLDAIRAFDAERYRPPLPEPVEPVKALETAARPSPESERMTRARKLVDEIRDQALAVGWTMDSLYFADGYERRPIGPRYGLVCYVGAQDRIGEVTRQAIELLGMPPVETRLRFYNPDVEQPWVIRSAGRQPRTPSPKLTD
jgi:hypothetical protein